MALWRETPTSSSSPQAFRMRITVSSAKSLRLAKETNKKIAVTAGGVRALLPSAFFFALPLVTGARTCWAVAGREETLQTATRPRDSAGQRSSVLLVQSRRLKLDRYCSCHEIAK